MFSRVTWRIDCEAVVETRQTMKGTIARRDWREAIAGKPRKLCCGELSGLPFQMRLDDDEST